MTSQESAGRQFARMADSASRIPSTITVGASTVEALAGAGLVPGMIVRDTLTRQFGRIQRAYRLKSGDELAGAEL
jgi:hypothetical protein